MNETQKRIRAYKAALPGLKERVIAVALLLVMSVAMMTSATFAWLTISRRPEVTGVATNITANGNLEIALATSEEAPGDSQVGDSSATEGQTIVGSNITWGNLVNLSDSSYGLDNLTLRPAQLNTAALLTSPLYGAEYGQDGRISKLNSSFGFATWNAPTEDMPGYFGVSTNLGVRAISSTKIEAVGAAERYLNMVKATTEANMGAADDYKKLASNTTYMQSLATLMGHYMTNRMNDADSGLQNPTCEIEDLENLRDMYGSFLGCFDKEAEAIARVIELQLFLTSEDGTYQPWTKEMVFATSQAQLNALGVQVSKFDQFKKDRNTIASDWEKLKEMCSSGQNMTWMDSGISGIVNNLVIVGTCTVENSNTDPTPINSIGATAALDYMGKSDNVAVITNGILYNFEERTGGRLDVKQMEISVDIKRSFLTLRDQKVKADIKTSAPGDYNLFTNDLEYAKSLNDGSYGGGIAVAEDTYGMALDLWVRTNAVGSYLTLEGNVITQTENVQAKTTDANGNEVDLYTVTVQVTDEEGNTQSQSTDMYKIVNDDKTESWYLAGSHTPAPEDQMQGAVSVLKTVEQVTVIGYEGENRIWSDNNMLSSDATTQGNGSCYVYYADTPEDQARSLRLLEAFNVAFVDSEGKKLATAIMDTERFYAESGRVIVPLTLSTTDSISLGEDYQGNVTRAITALEKNVPTRIMAIIYLDGTKLSNEEVLAASDIHGQLNIQFGSSQALEPIENEDLANKILQVTAEIPAAEREFDYDTHTGPMVSHVNLTINGDSPNTVTAFFLRSISSTQGSREQEMTFTYDEEAGIWTAQHEFKVPGNYVLRSVRLDGQEYDLATTPTVTVKGFALKSLSCQQATDGAINIMSAASSAEVDLSLQFATNDPAKMPSTVQGRFLRSDGTASNINFSYNATTGFWNGKATFITSGDYTLQYLVLDGEYTEIDAAFHQRAHVVLGMRVTVYTTSPHSFQFKADSMDANQKNLGMQVKIMDNAGNEMPGLSGAKLTYTMRGSATKKMDTDLIWDGSYYVGELHTTGPGVWQFSNVVVGSNILTTATSAPDFTIMSPEPPSYFGHYTTASQYAPDNDAVMTAQIAHSSAAKVEARIIRTGTSEEYWVEGVLGTTTDETSITNWTFPVPKNVSGYQDGNWKIVELKIYDAFDASGNEYTEDAPMLIDVSDTNNIAKVISQVYITFPEEKSEDFGRNADGTVTGGFMDSYTLSGLKVKIANFEGDPISGISDVKLTFAYKEGTSVNYGGYSGFTAANATVTVPLTGDGSGLFAQTGDVALRFAGQYVTTLQFSVNGKPAQYTSEDSNPLANLPVYTVSSVTPTVAITAISPTGSVTTNGATATNTYTATTADVYMGYSQSTGCTKYDRYTPSSVTITLSGIGNADSATLTFTGSSSSTPLYSTLSSNTTSNGSSAYTWEEDGTCLRYVGYVKRNGGNDNMELAGTMTANTLTLSVDGMTLTVTVTPAITITNTR